MTATIIQISDYLPTQSTRLVWRRADAKQWHLVAMNRPMEIWAAIAPYGDGERRGRGMFAAPTAKATCLHPDMQGRHGEYWVLGSTIAQAKRRMEAWLQKHRALIDFEISC